MIRTGIAKGPDGVRLVGADRFVSDREYLSDIVIRRVGTGVEQYRDLLTSHATNQPSEALGDEAASRPS